MNVNHHNHPKNTRKLPQFERHPALNFSWGFAPARPYCCCCWFCGYHMIQRSDQPVSQPPLVSVPGLLLSGSERIFGYVASCVLIYQSFFYLTAAKTYSFQIIFVSHRYISMLAREVWFLCNLYRIPFLKSKWKFWNFQKRKLLNNCEIKKIYKKYMLKK